jgi:predicted transcriptional regulator
MKAILMSIRPQWCELIVSGQKTIEVRKTAPKEVPFKVYIYETKGASETPWVDEDGHFIYKGSGKVIGEFICDKVNYINYETIEDYSGDVGDVCYNNSEYEKMCSDACIDYYSLFEYSSGKDLYALHITAVKAYDKPKELGEYGLTRPPQSWQYIQEKEECKEE